LGNLILLLPLSCIFSSPIVGGFNAIVTSIVQPSIPPLLILVVVLMVVMVVLVVVEVVVAVPVMVMPLALRGCGFLKMGFERHHPIT
jgi:hypothetical protein